MDVAVRVHKWTFFSFFSVEKGEEERIFQAFPRFWAATMDFLASHFDFAEQLNEFIKGK